MDDGTKPINNVVWLKLIIAISVIIMLIITIIAAFFSAKPVAADKIRVQDVLIIQKYLTQSKNDNAKYPASINGQPADYAKYIEFLPQPPAESGCSKENNRYLYESINHGQQYKISFCLQDKVQVLESN